MQQIRKILLAALFMCLSGHVAAFDLDAATLPAGYAGDDIKQWYRTFSGPGPIDAADRDGVFAFAVDLGSGPNFTREYDGGRLTLHYAMAFNQIAEGWSWDEQADPERRDYYRYKFLPLGHETESKRAPETLELYPGKTVEVKNLWRYEYFFAFDNLYDFYDRKVDDEAGFGAKVQMAEEQARAAQQAGRLGMLAVCRLKPQYHTESNTFWKATFAEPVDYTLRKRYLIGDLLEVWFYDKASGSVLAKVRRIGSGKQ